MSRRYRQISRSHREAIDRAREPTAEETAQALRDFPDNPREAARRLIELVHIRQFAAARARSDTSPEKGKQ